MVVGDKDCCARKDCGHGEIWHPTCCPRHHVFVEPLIIEGRVLLIGDRFYYDFPGDRDYPQGPKGLIECRFSGAEGRHTIIAKPKGFEKFAISRNNEVERFRQLKSKRSVRKPFALTKQNRRNI